MMSQKEPNNYICGHCKGEDIERSKYYDMPTDMIMYQVKCNECHFRIQMPVPQDAFSDPSFNLEFELQDAWNRASAKAQK